MIDFIGGLKYGIQSACGSDDINRPFQGTGKQFGMIHRIRERLQRKNGGGQIARCIEGGRELVISGKTAARHDYDGDKDDEYSSDQRGLFHEDPKPILRFLQRKVRQKNFGTPSGQLVIMQTFYPFPRFFDRIS